MFIAAINQLLWITFAPITGSAAAYYGVTDLSIGLLSMSFMIVYIIVSIPASWVIDTYGLRVAVGVGAALTGIFGLLRGLNENRKEPSIFSEARSHAGQRPQEVLRRMGLSRPPTATVEYTQSQGFGP